MQSQFGFPSSGITSPISKPGTPVPDYAPPNPVFRSSSATQQSLLDRTSGALERSSLDHRANISRSTSATTPGRERPNPTAGISMKKVRCFVLHRLFLVLQPP